MKHDLVIIGGTVAKIPPAEPHPPLGGRSRNPLMQGDSTMTPPVGVVVRTPEEPVTHSDATGMDVTADHVLRVTGKGGQIAVYAPGSWLSARTLDGDEARA